MTGISVASPTTATSNIKQPHRQNKDFTPAQRYAELKLAPERYSIIQLGIALYFYHDSTKEDAATATSAMSPNNDYHPRPYNNDVNNSNNTHHYSVAGSSSGVTRLPSSPLRSSSSTNNDSSSSSQNRRGYSTSGASHHASPKVVSMDNAQSQIPPGTTYSVRRYNFYMFPDATTSNTLQQLPRDIVMNVSAIAFLLEHDMSFDLWTRYGIPYSTSRSQAQSYMKAYIDQECRLHKEELGKIQQQQNSPVTIQSVVRNRVVLRRVEDIAFHARTMATLRDWLDSPISQPSTAPSNNVPLTSPCEYDSVDPYLEQSLLLPPCNSFLRRALYESIDSEYPTLVLERNNVHSGGNSGQQQIRVFRLNTEENHRRKQYLQKQRYCHFIMNQIGMYRIFAALRLVCNGYAIDTNHILFARSYYDIDWDIIFDNTGSDSPYDFTNTNDVDDVTAIIGLELAHGPDSNLSQYRTRRTPIPLVVHNGFMDLCFLMTHFVSYPLPHEYQECKQMLHTIFPYVYDTKILATECPCWDENDQHTLNSNLATLFHMTGRIPPDQNSNRVLLDDIFVVPAVTTKMSSAKFKNNERNVAVTVDDQEHEAAYDAYMTGVIFIGLCQRIYSRIPHSIARCATANSAMIAPIFSSNSDIYTELRKYYGLNKLYQMSIYTMDLEETLHNRDPMSRGLIAKYTYRISNIDPAVTTRDVVTSLSNLHDTENRPINFLIIWIDDTTFLVAASYSPPTIQPAASSVSLLQPAAAVDAEPPEEGEEVEETAEAAVDATTGVTNVNDTVDGTMNDNSDSILREHADMLLKALRVRFSNTETTIVVLEDYLDAQSVAANDDDTTNQARLAHQQSNSWTNRLWFMMGWPFNSTKATTTKNKHAYDESIESLSANKRQRIR